MPRVASVILESVVGSLPPRPDATNRPRNRCGRRRLPSLTQFMTPRAGIARGISLQSGDDSQIIFRIGPVTRSAKGR